MAAILKKSCILFFTKFNYEWDLNNEAEIQKYLEMFVKGIVIPNEVFREQKHKTQPNTILTDLMTYFLYYPGNLRKIL